MLTIWAIILAVIPFCAQLVLCRRTKNLLLRLVPLFLILTGLLISGAIYAGWFTAGQGGIRANELLGLVLAIMLAVAAAGDALGWAIYALICAGQRKKL